MDTLSVSECVKNLNAVLETQVVLVEGEVQGFRVSQGRWGFFTLKDEQSVIECCMMAFRIRVPLEDGMTIRVTATPGIHAKSGRFRLTVEHIEVVGEGALKRAFEILRKKLEAEGLFSEARKRRLPLFPERIGLIASSESAAYSDFLKVLSARFGGLEVVTAHVSVQGARAVEEVIAALEEMARLKQPLEAIVITRGGGSLEDLMAFNDEQLARAIYGCAVPVVAAIGHERDSTIADYVADVRASTPSNAAELLVRDRREVMSQLLTLRDRLESGLGRRLMIALHDIDRLTHYYVSALEMRKRSALLRMQRFFAASEAFLGRCRQTGLTISEVERRIIRAMTEQTQRVRDSLIERQKLFQSLHPNRLLNRGYSIVRSRGRVVTSKRSLRLHDRLDIALKDGSVEAEVTNISL